MFLPDPAAEYQDFISALLNGRMDKDVLRFDREVPWLYSSGVYNIYIRQSYKELHLKISHYLSQKNVIIVSGNPGIGKSLFLVYELYLALSAGESVLFYSVPMRMYAYFSPQENSVIVSSDEELLHYYPSCVCFVDGGTNEKPKVSATKLKIIYFSYSCIEDLAKNEHSATLYMPAWSKKEVKTVLRCIYTYLDFYESLKRFEKYGGIMRSIRTENIQHVESELSGALYDCTISTVNQVGTASQSKGSHVLYHDEPSDDYRN